MRRVFIFFIVCISTMSCYALNNPYAIEGASFVFDCNSWESQTAYTPIKRVYDYWYETWTVVDYDPETKISIIEKTRRSYRYDYQYKEKFQNVSSMYGWDKESSMGNDTIRQSDDMFFKKKGNNWEFFFCSPQMTTINYECCGKSRPANKFGYSNGGLDTFKYEYGGTVYNIVLKDHESSLSEIWTDLGFSYYYIANRGGGLSFGDEKKLIWASIPDPVNYPELVYSTIKYPEVRAAQAMYVPDEMYTKTYNGKTNYLAKGCIGLFYYYPKATVEIPRIYAINLNEGFWVEIQSADFSNTVISSFTYNPNLLYHGEAYMEYRSGDDSQTSKYNRSTLIWLNSYAKTEGNKPPYSLKDAWEGDWLFVFAGVNEVYWGNHYLAEIWNAMNMYWGTDEYWDVMSEFANDTNYPALYLYIGDEEFRHTYDMDYKQDVPVIDEDVNGDGNVNSLDVLKVYKFMQTSTGEVKDAIEDVNGDGDVNSLDVLKIYKYMQSH